MSGPSKAPVDWSVEVPEDLWRGLLHAVSIDGWRRAFRDDGYLKARLKGFRPANLPLKRLDQVVLKGLEEDVPLRERALELVDGEHAGLRERLLALGNDATKAGLDAVLREASVAAAFWVAFGAGERLAPVRDAILARLAAGTLPGDAPLVPERVERREGAGAGDDIRDGDGARAGADGGAATPLPGAPAAVRPPVEELSERLRRAEREMLRAREGRDRAVSERRLLEDENLKLKAERDRLDLALEALRRTLAEQAAVAEAGAASATAGALGRELKRQGRTLAEERRRVAAATQRVRELERENARLEREVEYHAGRGREPAYPKEPAAISVHLPGDKIQWPSDEHHWPKRLKPFLERLARVPQVDRIHLLGLENSTESRIRSIDRRGDIYLLYSDGEKGARVLLETVGKDPNEGLWIAEHLCALDPSIQPIKEERIA